MQAIASYRQVNEKTTQRRRHRILNLGAARAFPPLPASSAINHCPSFLRCLITFANGWVGRAVFMMLGLTAILTNKSRIGKSWTPHTYHAYAGALALCGVSL
eukprot:COSAG02_NODE_2778_length_8051_cov_829.131162_7_plen_102_part_00